MKDIVKPIAVLAAICLVVTALLAAVNSLTSPIIAEANEKAKSEAMKEVLSEADGFDELKIDLPDGVTEAYKASNGAGYVFMINAKGYGGTIEFVCGILPDGTVEKTKTLNHSEASGIGSRVVDNKSGERLKFDGKTADNYEEVDSITGATISSKAFKKAMGSAFEAYSRAKEAE